MPLSFQELAPFLARTNLVALPGTDIYLDPERGDAPIAHDFDDGAQSYHQRYNHHGKREALLQRAFSLADFSLKPDASIFDMGAGTGNSAIPLARMPGKPKVVATDLAPKMLQMLRYHLIQDFPDIHDRIGLICTDIGIPLFADGAFDLVVGDAILHHLLDPEAAVEQALKTTRPGGLIVFMEPFEQGAHLMAMMFRDIIETAQHRSGLPNQVLTMLEALIIDYEARFGYPRMRPNTPVLNDKWIFNKLFFWQMADRHHCQNIWFADGWAGEQLDRKLEEIFANHIRNIGADSETLPEWVWDIVRGYDRDIGPELKKRIMVKGVVIFKK